MIVERFSYLWDESRRKKKRKKSDWVAYLATVDIRRATGSGPTYGVITSINTRCNAEDVNSTADTVNPIQIPASGTNYSYWVSTQLYVSVAPVTAISNIRWYTSGTNPFGTGVDCYAKDVAAASYSQATGTLGVSGTQLSGTTEVFSNYTSSTPLSVTGSIGATTGILGDFVVFQIAVGGTASSGATPTATFTWIYDES